jgi:membrane-associated phospholipid phosphatase
MTARRVVSADSPSRALGQCSAGCGVFFLLLAIAVSVGWDSLVAFDKRWSSRAFSFTLAHGWCETLARAATSLGNGLTVAAATAVAAIVCVVARRRMLGLWLAVTVAGSALVNSAIKYAMERARPTSAGLVTSAHGFAFPSGHTQIATVTYPAVILVVGWQLRQPGQLVRRVSAAVVTVVVAAVGLSRVFLGAHWPTDVLGGWLFGSAWVTASTAVLLRGVAASSTRTGCQ